MPTPLPEPFDAGGWVDVARAKQNMLAQQQQMDQIQRQNTLDDQARANDQQVTNALARGDYAGARGLATSPKTFAAIQDLQNDALDRAQKQNVFSATQQFGRSIAGDDPTLSAAAATGSFPIISAAKDWKDKNDVFKAEQTQKDHLVLYNLVHSASADGDPEQTRQNFWKGLAAAKMYADTPEKQAALAKTEQIARTQGEQAAIDYEKSQLDQSGQWLSNEKDRRQQAQESMGKLAGALQAARSRNASDDDIQRIADIYQKSGQVGDLSKFYNRDGKLDASGIDAIMGLGLGGKTIYDDANRGGGKGGALDKAWATAKEQAELAKTANKENEGKPGYTPQEENPTVIFRKNTGVDYKDALAQAALSKADTAQGESERKTRQGDAVLEEKARSNQANEGIRKQLANAASQRAQTYAEASDNKANLSAEQFAQKRRDADNQFVSDTAFAYRNDEDGWRKEGIPSLQRAGIGVFDDMPLNVALGMGKGNAVKAENLSATEEKNTNTALYQQQQAETAAARAKTYDAAVQNLGQHQANQDEISKTRAAAWADHAANQDAIASRRADISDRIADIRDRLADNQVEIAKAKLGLGTKEMQNAAFFKSAIEASNPGVTVPLDMAAKLAANPSGTDIQVMDNPDGSKTPQLITKPKGVGGATFAAAAQTQKENIAHNQLHPDDPLPTDMATLFDQASGHDTARKRLEMQQQALALRGRTVSNAERNVAVKELLASPEGAYNLSVAKGEGAADAKIVALRGALVGPAAAHTRHLVEELQSPDADKTLGLIHSSTLYQRIRGQLWPSDIEVPSEWGKIGQDIQSLQAEAERVYTTGQGAITDTERARLARLTQQIPEAPNRQVALNLAQNLQKLLAGILTSPTTKDLMNDPTLQEARKGSLKELEGVAQDEINSQKKAAPRTNNLASPTAGAGQNAIAPSSGENPNIEARGVLNGKPHVKINGQWYPEQ